MTLNVMAVCGRQENVFRNWSLIPQLAQWTALAWLADGITFRNGSLVKLSWSMGHLTRQPPYFSRTFAMLESTSETIQSTPQNKSLYLPVFLKSLQLTIAQWLHSCFTIFVMRILHRFRLRAKVPQPLANSIEATSSWAMKLQSKFMKRLHDDVCLLLYKECASGEV